jgi:NADPH:quinone reductase-like Zn-dependent oxidoreductase
MRAMILREPAGLDNLKMTTLPDPGKPGSGQILVRLRASSLNYHDYAVALGTIKTADNRVPLSDGAGEVVELGDGVTAFAPGDSVVSTFFEDWSDGRVGGAGSRRVLGDGIDGCAREFAVMPASAFIHAPKGYSHAEAATLTCAGVTAWRALVVNGGIKAGDVVLVLGTGGVSTIALQLAKAMGATVIATSASDEKLERAKALGADHVINYKAVPNWGVTAFEVAGGGVDHVVEVGGPGTLSQSIQAVRVGGHIALIGTLTGLQGPVLTVMLLAKQIRLQGVNVGSKRDQQDLVRAVESNSIRPTIDRTFPLEALGDAFRYQESGKHFGKIGINI